MGSRSSQQRDLEKVASEAELILMGKTESSSRLSREAENQLWKDLLKEIEEVKTNLGYETLPPQKILQKNGYWNLVDRIGKFGGFYEVRVGLNEELKEVKKGTWTDLDYTLSKAQDFMRHNEYSTLPSNKELRKLGEGKLAAAIFRHHGGIRKFRRILSEKIDTLQECSDSSPPITELRRPDGYYEDWDHVVADIEKAKKAAGYENLPPMDVLYAHNFSTLAQAISNHWGGYSKVRDRLNEDPIQVPLNTWKNLDYTMKRARTIMEENGFEALPSSERLVKLQESSLAAAIYKYHGGIKKFRYLLEELSDLPSIHKGLEKLDLPPHVKDIITASINKEIRSLEAITTQTLAGMSGGGVVRVEIPELGKTYVSKVDGNSLVAYKCAVVPTLVHQASETDVLAAKLAQRIPKPLFSRPNECQGYYVSIAEDVSQKVITSDNIDLFVVVPELAKIKGKRNYDLTVIDKLFTTALYHHVVTKICDQESDPLLATEVFNTNNDFKLIQERLGSKSNRGTKIVETEVLAIYDSWYHELLENQLRGTIQTIGDNKIENYVPGYGGSSFVDLGLTKTADEVDDLARLFMTDSCSCMSSDVRDYYIDCYIRMRQELQKFSPQGLVVNNQVTYNPEVNNLRQLVTKQTAINTLKHASWAIYTCKDDLAGQLLENAQIIFSKAQLQLKN